MNGHLITTSLYGSIVYLDYTNGFGLDINEIDAYLMTYLDNHDTNYYNVGSNFVNSKYRICNS